MAAAEEAEEEEVDAQAAQERIR
jgi:hypothetical protein